MIEADAEKIVDWNEPIATNPSVQPSDSWHVGVDITGSSVAYPDRILATGIAYTYNDKGNGHSQLRCHDGVFSSEDGGRTWRWFAPVGDYEPRLAVEPSYEGPNESFMIGLIALTTGTALVETSPNHLLMVYDRDPERPPTSPNDLSRVYVMPIEIERN